MNYSNFISDGILLSHTALELAAEILIIVASVMFIVLFIGFGAVLVFVVIKSMKLFKRSNNMLRGVTRDIEQNDSSRTFLRFMRRGFRANR